MKSTDQILVVAAHPDDEILGCGATIPKLIDSGHQVDVGILGEGITSRYDKREDADQALIETLQNQAREVSELLGVHQLFLRELPDNRFDSVDMLDIVKIVEAMIEQSDPDIVYTHHDGDLNIDHQITHQAVLTATRPLPENSVKEIYGFEVLSSTEWNFGSEKTHFSPNVFQNIGGYLDQKIEAMSEYSQEIDKFPHPRSPESIRNLAKHRGSTAGLEVAESFELIRKLQL